MKTFSIIMIIRIILNQSVNTNKFVDGETNLIDTSFLSIQNHLNWKNSDNSGRLFSKI